MSGVQKIYSGFLKLGSNGEEEDVLFLSSKPLAEALNDLHHKIATIRYYISDKEVTLEQAQQLFVDSLFGKVDAIYNMHYSDITGYLWTDEELNVGGHNLLNELMTYLGKYLILVADINEIEEEKK